MSRKRRPKVPQRFGVGGEARMVKQDLLLSRPRRHTLALDDKNIPYSWGWGLCGQLGHGDYPAAIAFPRAILDLSPDNPDASTQGVKAVSAGGIHSAAIDRQGRVWTWGESSYGQLGQGREACQGSKCKGTPGLVVLAKGGTAPLVAVSISCGGMHSAALTANGELYTWGRADNGQLGIGRTWLEEGDPEMASVDHPVLVLPENFDSPVKQVACGAFHTAAVTLSGRVYTWGKEEHGMLGHDVAPDKLYDAQDVPKEVQNMEHIGVAESVACGGWHTAVVTTTGKLFTCGRGEYGRLGVGQQSSHLTLVQVAGVKDEHVVRVSAGGTHTMVLTKGGRLYTYGRGDYGRLGHGSVQHSFVPKIVEALQVPGWRVVDICAGGGHSAALLQPDLSPQPVDVDEVAVDVQGGGGGDGVKAN